MKAVVAAFNQEKALVGAFSVIVQPVVEPMDSFTALVPGPGQEEVTPGGGDTQSSTLSPVQRAARPGVMGYGCCVAHFMFSQ